MSAYDCYDFYLRVDDLKDLEHVVKISNAYQKEFYNSRLRQNERKIVLCFENRKRKMILNPTQAGAVMDITGTEHEQKWIGAELVLKTGKAINGKKTIIVSDRAHSDDINIMYPADAVKPTVGKNVLVPV